MARGSGRCKALALALVGTALAASPAAACKLAILGDSLTAGYGVGIGEAFPARLASALAAQGAPCEVVDAGVSGDTSAGGAARVAWVLDDRPTHLLVELGGNDALRALPVDQLRRNLEQIIQAARARNIPVMLAGMLAPPNLGRAYGDRFRAVFTDLAAAYSIPLYPFFLDGAVLQDGLMQPDGIHPNARGVGVIVERIAPMVVEFVQVEAG